MTESENHFLPSIWKHFEEICRIPRPSKSEDKIIGYVLAFAKQHNLKAKKDEIGNVLICKPASPGMEDRKTVILQSHLDMVGEKETSSSHDFSRDPIIPIEDGGWIRAEGTTLGADDGIGIAVQLVILESKDLVHGPLECLFTVDEESGMTGAKQLQPGFMKGSILLNLDSEDEGELFIGCAGGIDTIGSFRFKMETMDPGEVSYKAVVEGLKGGHSGDEIHKSPGQAIKVLNRFLLDGTEKYGLKLSFFDGGNMRNAIPRDAYAVFTIPGAKSEELEQFFGRYTDSVIAELREYEPDLQLTLKKTNPPEWVLPKTSQLKFLRTIDNCPHGVISWSSSLEGLVETSSNLASVKFPEKDTAILTTSQRSSVESAKNEIANHIYNCMADNGAMVEHTDGYPGWTPNTDSEILKISALVYEELFGNKPVVRAIHAGLECGLILEKYPGLDMISFGPTIRGAHTPTERIDIESTGKFWNLLMEVLRRIPSGQE